MAKTKTKKKSPSPKDGDLEGLKIGKLKEMAKRLGVSGYSTKKNNPKDIAKLIKLIKEAKKSKKSSSD